jgi:hypothetical protein
MTVSNLVMIVMNYTLEEWVLDVIATISKECWMMFE